MTNHGYLSLGPDGMRLEPAGNLLNKRVRYRGQATCGTVVIDVNSPKVGVIWDAAPRHMVGRVRINVSHLRYGTANAP
jgi:hypothetical protein